jgi:predicted CXXCH cytochrome family protein
MNRPLSLLLCILVIFSLAGCGGQESYKVLSFFFDGVPKPVEKSEQGAEGKGEAVAKGRGEASTHGPYAARLCHACHEEGSNALVLPVRELCLKCHQFKMNKKYVHGPLVSGGCIICHDPHSSGNRYLLVSREQTFCFHCHEEKAIEKNAAHKGVDMTQCTSCHDAHMSDKKYLLR